MNAFGTSSNQSEPDELSVLEKLGGVRGKGLGHSEGCQRVHSTSSVTFIQLYARNIFSFLYIRCSEEGWERIVPGSIKSKLSRGTASANPSVYSERGGKTLRDHSSGITGPWTTLHPGGWQCPGKGQTATQPLGKHSASNAQK